MEDKIKSDLKQAQFDRDELKVSVLRMLLSSISYRKIQQSGDLSEADVLDVLQKEAKKRRESIDSFTQAGRADAAEKETAELHILESYLPAQISDEELTKNVEEAINETGATSLSDMGKVISLVMSRVGASVDGSRVSSKVKQILTS